MAGPGKCRECGAGLKAGSAACPLCGTIEGEATNQWLGEAPRKELHLTEDGPPPDKNSYHASIQSLRTELTKLRKQAS